MTQVLGVRLRLTNAGWRIDELVNGQGNYITWPGLWEDKVNAAKEVQRVRPDVDWTMLMADAIMQEA